VGNGLLDQLADVLKEYAGGSTQVPSNVNDHFDRVSELASPNSVAEGIATAFHSHQTPAFGQMLGRLFFQSTGEQKAGILNQLASSLGPSGLSQLAGGGALAGLVDGRAEAFTLEQAQAVSPDVVEQLATHAERSDPSIVEKSSAFYAQHPALVKTLGGAALSIVLAHMAQRKAA
jgi:hypothetical protein